MWEIATDFWANVDRDVFMIKLSGDNHIITGGTF